LPAPFHRELFARPERADVSLDRRSRRFRALGGQHAGDEGHCGRAGRDSPGNAGGSDQQAPFAFVQLLVGHVNIPHRWKVAFYTNAAKMLSNK
jgi:hypothetical protein